MGAGPDMDPHPELRNPRPGPIGTSYDCNICGKHWTYRSESGWKSEREDSRGHRKQE